MTRKQTVGVLGAGGTMGFAIARNLARAGLGIRAWNRSPERVRRLAKDGAEIADDPSAAADDADVILTMLADADAGWGFARAVLVVVRLHPAFGGSSSGSGSELTAGWVWGCACS